MTTEPLGSYRLFRDYDHGIDSAVTLFTLIQSVATDAQVIVDVGCGRGAMIDGDGDVRRIHDMRAPGREVIGIDVDPVGVENPVIDRFALIENNRWPLEDGTVDLAHCDWVLEHIADPQNFVSELHRVLRPGGVFIARTVSKHSLLSLGARMVPNDKHASLLERLQPGRQAKDVFPTTYLMNSDPALHQLLDGRFEWASSYHPGLKHYFMRRPGLAKAVAAVEARLPRRNQHALVLAARKL
jgi:SAM-dependent methyltransferase